MASASSSRFASAKARSPVFSTMASTAASSCEGSRRISGALATDSMRWRSAVIASMGCRAWMASLAIRVSIVATRPSAEPTASPPPARASARPRPRPVVRASPSSVRSPRTRPISVVTPRRPRPSPLAIRSPARWPAAPLLRSASPRRWVSPAAPRTPSRARRAPAAVRRPSWSPSLDAPRRVLLSDVVAVAAVLMPRL